MFDTRARGVKYIEERRPSDVFLSVIRRVACLFISIDHGAAQYIIWVNFLMK